MDVDTNIEYQYQAALELGYMYEGCYEWGRG